MSATVHSRRVGCQNLVKFGPRSYWMTPKSSSTEEWRSNTSFLWQNTLRNTTRPRRPFRHIFLGKSYSFSCPFTSVLQMMFWEISSSLTQSQLNIVTWKYRFFQIRCNYLNQNLTTDCVFCWWTRIEISKVKHYFLMKNTHQHACIYVVHFCKPHISLGRKPRQVGT